MFNLKQATCPWHKRLWNKMAFILLTGVIINSCAEKTHLTSQRQIQEAQQTPPAARRAEILFLGHASEHHPSRKYAPWLATAVFSSGINITYTENLEDL